MNIPSARRIAEAMQQGLDLCNVEMILGCYADDAELSVVDRNHPPSSPLTLRGKQAIGEYYRDICGREMQHNIDQEVIGDRHLAFVEAGEYLDGTRVLAAEVCELRDGKIARQFTVQAWDEQPRDPD